MAGGGGGTRAGGGGGRLAIGGDPVMCKLISRNHDLRAQTFTEVWSSAGMSREPSPATLKLTCTTQHYRGQNHNKPHRIERYVRVPCYFNTLASS